MPASTVRGRVRPSRPQPIGPPAGAVWGKGDPIRRARWSSYGAAPGSRRAVTDFHTPQSGASGPAPLRGRGPCTSPGQGRGRPKTRPRKGRSPCRTFRAGSGFDTPGAAALHGAGKRALPAGPSGRCGGLAPPFRGICVGVRPRAACARRRGACSGPWTFFARVPFPRGSSSKDRGHPSSGLRR